MRETSNFTRLQEVVMSNSENSNNWNDAKNEWRVKSCFVKENENSVSRESTVLETTFSPFTIRDMDP